MSQNVLKWTFFLLGFMCLSVNKGQSLEWVKSFGGSGDDYGGTMALDNSGNIYTAGIFRGSVDFDPGPGEHILTSVGYGDVFIQKLDPEGNFIWARSFGSDWHDYLSSIAVDALGNVYVTGEFSGLFYSDSDFNSPILTTNLSWDAYLLKLDSSSDLVWVKSFGSTGNDAINYVGIDDLGSIYLTGNFQQTVDFDPGPSVVNLTAVSGSDSFILKLDSSGDFIWVESFEASCSFCNSYVDGSGNVFTTGSFSGEIDFDPGPESTLLDSSVDGKVFIQKVDALGNFVWATAYGETDSFGYVLAQEITMDIFGNIYCTGRFTNTVDFSPGSTSVSLTSSGGTDGYVIKFNNSGNFVWARNFGGTDDEFATFSAVDSEGNIYTTGSFLGEADFAPGTGTATIASAGQYDLYVRKMDSSGNFLDVQTFGASGLDWGTNVTVLSNGDIFILGTYQQTVDFDPGPETAYCTSLGGDDVFIQKMSQGSLNSIAAEQGAQIKIFPNPNFGLVQVVFDRAFNDVEISLMDIQGRLIWSEVVDVETREELQIDGASGIYFLNVRTSNEQKIFKLIKR